MKASDKAIKISDFLMDMSYRETTEEFSEELQEAAFEILRLSAVEQDKISKGWQRVECTRCGKFIERS